MRINTDQRPWGWFREFTLNEISTVKILGVKAGHKFSLQSHKGRDEFWRVLAGNPVVTVGDKEKVAKEGDEFYIPKETKHRIGAVENDAQVLEISFGVFDEKDEVRFEDDYGRS